MGESHLLTEQIIGRGLRRSSYDVLNQPLEERTEDSDETVDAFGVPFIGFPVQKRKRPRTGEWGQKPVWIEWDDAKRRYRVHIPNVQSWAVGVRQPLNEIIRVEELPELVITPKETPTDIHVFPVVGGRPEAVMRLDEFRKEYPVLKTVFMLAEELLDRTNPANASGVDIGPTFDELLDVA